MRAHLILLAALFVGCGTTTAVHEFDPADLEKAEESDEMVGRPFTTEETTTTKRSCASTATGTVC
ncbi:MAG: hypothetical protein ACYTDU_06860 [Planctomycetota bacterium]|jgi:hypothetical protein